MVLSPKFVEQGQLKFGPGLHFFNLNTVLGDSLLL